jgi:predicted transcriptional regulator
MLYESSAFFTRSTFSGGACPSSAVISKSFLASEAIERYLEVEAWQVNEIKAALKEADNQDFNSEKEFAKLVKKHAG